ncbi:hypothetical protein AMTRI_Chr06g195620 [Amborella trichopoda]
MQRGKKESMSLNNPLSEEGILKGKWLQNGGTKSMCSSSPFSETPSKVVGHQKQKLDAKPPQKNQIPTKTSLITSRSTVLSLKPLKSARNPTDPKKKKKHV